MVLVVILVVVWFWWISWCWFCFGGNVVVMYVEHSLGIQNTFGDTKGGNISVAKTHCTNDLELM